MGLFQLVFAEKWYGEFGPRNGGLQLTIHRVIPAQASWDRAGHRLWFASLPDITIPIEIDKISTN